MTIIYLFTRWLEAISTTDITAEITCKAYIHHWISYFDCLVTITIDQGKNFELHLLKHLTNTLGINHVQTILYHPQSNGVVKWYHRHLKSSIIAHNHPTGFLH